MANENTAVATTQRNPGKSYIMKMQETYLRVIENQFLENRLAMPVYAKECITNALVAIHEMLEKKGVRFENPDIDQSSLTIVLRQVASLRLNAGVSPREVFFSIRSEKRGNGWVKKIEMGIEGDGNDKLLREYGANVKRVGAPWLVREGDEFTYPIHTGFDVTPPVWKPTGKGKVVRVVYAIEQTDGSCEYIISEREDVRPNLVAHISNNLQNETFGMAKSRFDADLATKAKIDTQKRHVLDMIKPLSLEQILDDPALQNYISPAWTEPQSREQMIIRKMRNNAVKKYPKDFGHALVSDAYNQTDEVYKAASIEAESNAGRDAVEIEAVPVNSEPVGQPDPTSDPPRAHGEQTTLEEPGF